MLGTRLAPLPSTAGWAPQQKRTTKQKGFGGDWKRRRLRILQAADWLCQCADCGRLDRTRPASEVDHKVPRYLGGSDGDENLQAINKDCHKAKSQREAQAAMGR